MATTVASIMVGNLTSDALYVDHLVCEAYADALLTQLVAQDSATVKNVSGVWTQQGVMTFNGLALGATYYLRAGVVAPLSDNITWSATFAVTAGSFTAPAPTFIFQSTKTGSGISYVVTPASLPLDVDHFEAWWSMDGTTPALTQPPLWTGALNAADYFTFFIGCISTQTPTVYVRAVNTSTSQQAWLELEVTSGGTLDNVADGTSYVKGAQYASGVVAVPNGNFQADTTLPGGAPTGWIANIYGFTGDVTCSYDTTTPYAGSQSVVLTATGATAGIASTQKFAVIPGDAWKLTGAMKSLTGAQAVVQLQFVGSAGTPLAAAVLSTTGTSWLYQEATQTVPAGAVYGYLFCQMDAIGAGEFDNIQLIRLANMDTEILDGTTYVRLSDVNSDHTFHKSTSLINQGSLVTLPENSFVYTCTTTSINWGWSSYLIYAPDGSVITIGASSAPPFTGLAPSTTYYFSFYYDLIGSQTVALLSDVSGGKAVSSAQQQCWVAAGDTHVLIDYNVPAATVSSGGGGGGHGGGGICLTPGTKVKGLHGTKAICELVPGDHVFTARRTWRPVREITRRHWNGPVHAMGQDEFITPRHMVLRDGVWVPSRTILTATQNYFGMVCNMHIDTNTDDDGSGSDTEHSYTLANGEIVHNVQPIPC